MPSINPMKKTSEGRALPQIVLGLFRSCFYLLVIWDEITVIMMARLIAHTSSGGPGGGYAAPVPSAQVTSPAGRFISAEK